MTIAALSEEFMNKAQGIDPEHGRSFIPNLLERIDKNTALVTNDIENNIWGKLLETSINLSDGSMSFIDYLSSYTLLTAQLRKLGEIQREGNIRGKRL